MAPSGTHMNPAEVGGGIYLQDRGGGLCLTFWCMKGMIEENKLIFS
jgi:hypothetical protein